MLSGYILPVKKNLKIVPGYDHSNPLNPTIVS